MKNEKLERIEALRKLLAENREGKRKVSGRFVQKWKEEFMELTFEKATEKLNISEVSIKIL